MKMAEEVPAAQQTIYFKLVSYLNPFALLLFSLVRNSYGHWRQRWGVAAPQTLAAASLFMLMKAPKFEINLKTILLLFIARGFWLYEQVTTVSCVHCVYILIASYAEKSITSGNSMVVDGCAWIARGCTCTHTESGVWQTKRRWICFIDRNYSSGFYAVHKCSGFEMISLKIALAALESEKTTSKRRHKE